MSRSRTRHVSRAAALLAALSLALTACGSSSSQGGDSGEKVDAAAVESALQAGGDLTVWAWEPTLKKVVSDFQAKYPKVHVKLVNAGTGNDQYTALQNAIKAGSGVPDLAQVEYYALPQFALGKSLTDLNRFGAGSLKSSFTTGPWTGVTSGDALYGLPMDSGPMALFYNKTIFDKYDVAVPTTWEQYLEAARKIHKADPKIYITSDTGDAGFTTSMIWQAGGKPFQVQGTSVKVDLADSGTARFTQLWQKLIDEKLLSPITGWSDEWYKGLGDGSLATLVTGAWMPANFSGAATAASGQWRVAPMPQWTAGGTATAENGGSSLTVPAASRKATLAYGFLRYATADAGATTRVEQGAFPATTADLTSESFLNKSFPYFGGQQVNKVLSEAATQVVSGWSYLPFQVYANNIYKDTVGKAYTGASTLSKALVAWQDACKEYGSTQGFTLQ
ncbi:MAG: multiple sugar transport system substrate-binding protein [Actinomycetota bacterium]|nr:multiple sugar transport system substrate-binding protein [Actinomycetota bacterium]